MSRDFFLTPRDKRGVTTSKNPTLYRWLSWEIVPQFVGSHTGTMERIWNVGTGILQKSITVHRCLITVTLQSQSLLFNSLLFLICGPIHCISDILSRIDRGFLTTYPLAATI
eukprot:sb/3477046/